MLHPFLRRALWPLLAALALGACQAQHEPGQPAADTPEAAVQRSIDLLRAGDFNALLQHALPPEDYANLRADWQRRQHNPQPVSAAERARFNDVVRKLTGPDAENRLYAELQPKLVAVEQQYQDQLPLLIGVGDALLKRSLSQSQTLSSAQTAQIDGMLDVLLPWAQQASWFDQAKARQAIHVAVTTAQKLDLTTPEQLHTMDFDTTVARYGTAYEGVKQLLLIYGLSVDDTLASVKLTPLAADDDRAVVRIDYTLLDKPLRTESTLLRENGRWYSADLLRNARHSHQQLRQEAALAATLVGPATKDGSSQPLE